MSSNGTYVNMVKLGKHCKARLCHNDIVTLCKPEQKQKTKGTKMTWLFQLANPEKLREDQDYPAAILDKYVIKANSFSHVISLRIFCFVLFFGGFVCVCVLFVCFVLVVRFCFVCWWCYCLCCLFYSFVLFVWYCSFVCIACFIRLFVVGLLVCWCVYLFTG